MPSQLTLETAHTPAEHMAIFKRYGVLWWWRLKESDAAHWNGGTLMETVIENGVEYRFARSFSDLFRHRYERSAFEYERLARNKEKGKSPKFEFGKPWFKLTQNQRDELARRWPMPQGERIPYLWRACRSEPWANECFFNCHAFNLRASDSALAEAFKEMLRFERQRLRIKPTIRKGRRTKSYPWRALEQWDLVNYEGKKRLSAAQRSMLSKARKGQ